MTTSHFVLFDRRSADPGRDLPVGVYDTRVAAEANQLNLQQDKAASYNIRRHDAFTRGDGFPGAKTAADYTNDFYITEVLTP
jgi:hypothetical protein